MLVVRHAVVGPFAANCWLAACGRTGEAVLVDPGAEVHRALALADPSGWRITRIFCTHGHIDHVGGGAEARAATGAPLQIHAADDAWLAALPRQAEMFGFDPVEAPEVDHHHVDGEAFRVGDCEAQVIHTPGHSAGSCSLWFPGEQILFTGDTLFAGSVGRTDLPGGDFDALERSIKERLFPLGDAVRFHPGHGPAGTLGEERRANPFVGESPRRGRFI
ncbi:beta-lactamase domain protein [Anaeromyxobacter dehalogenans 2CP-1]|uniref:Beta-lactamase domain protein n=1 Tax=Anaeromyxobacter dehalogenans (strain ATCC BAA-258 / DSM 21875 / 2CP-1) TaxID=455488 RepID=B8J666_ANAD2|nr:MBL fold metallo-hydrolase [Anaeromyxobacter dehalogenans]ACL66961.1 beta-lactamase domain protein [Anaeromyxobacter dehalogenans 2CP-1]